jgi:thymidylate synthase
MEHLIKCDGGKDFNLVIAIQNPCVEIPEATRVIDQLAKDLELKSTMENANAIWPSFFARPKRKSAEVFTDIKRYAIPAIKTACSNKHDSYVERLVAWRSAESGTPVPQLQNVLTRIKNEVKNPAPKSSSYEISIYSPGLDAGYMSFPCLSHLSFKYDRRRGLLHLTALYRNHTYLTHAYGNFVGLGRLMQFVCRETEICPGELISISTHADAEIGGRKSRAQATIARVREILIERGSKTGPVAD